VSQVRTALFLLRPAYEGCGFGSDRFTAVRFCETVGSLIGYLLELNLLLWKRGSLTGLMFWEFYCFTVHFNTLNLTYQLM